MKDRVAFVLKGYPRLSETFIAQEIRELEERGLDIEIFSLRHPTDRQCHPVHREIRAPVHYLPEYLRDQPLRLWRAWRAARRLPGYPAARRLWWRDLRRDPTANRIRRFGQALVLAHELDPEVTQLHAHFLHTPASVARYAAHLVGLPWTVSAHAKDIWTIPDWEKAEKLADCAWAVTCSRSNADHLAALAPVGRVELVYHGIDLDRFDNVEAGVAPPFLRLLTVGRTVEKKGHDDLLKALALLPADLDWRLCHIGGGPLGEDLERHARDLGLDGRITWMGAQTQTVVLRQYRQADLFLLASRIGDDGDRDGLPNVLLEAQSQGVACIATAVAAIPELIEDGVTGLLTPERDPAALADAIRALARDPERRRTLGRAGQTRVRREFSLRHCLDPLAQKFGLIEATPPRRAVG